MPREVIPNETIPLDRFADELKSRARAVGRYAISHGFTAPRDVQSIVDASPADLRTAQLRRKLTYRELDEWLAIQLRDIDTADAALIDLSIF